MLEACFQQAILLKSILETVREFVTECNLDCNDSGIALQATENYHVALFASMLRSYGFDPYRCDRNLPLGLNLTNLSKILKCARNDDILTLKTDDDGDVLSLVFENSDPLSSYDFKLMDIDSEHLDILETTYEAVIQMPSTKFQEIVHDLFTLSDFITIECTKGGIKFSADGEIGKGSVTVETGSSLDNGEESTIVELNQSVSMSFAVKYLVSFTKTTPLSSCVGLKLTADVPLLPD
ncbi:hypothetical protein G6F46_011286 [Rhizopus delemar]|uniref:DNA sliding clamp PCNA n=2 Tax=Rhizopus TaxID=4842 RepID=A0A9P6YTI6_9FUNG|nr:hypothetical protein G6F36_008204 [Rhizopus arrhizus]KAG1453034.1 hypothetical protein G6F55_008354 [Rhizopus delemar]KAG1490111.1 hypothetical protein G6F54_010961 [Rhizopus delemar]KAG1501005.1 hypothetical protein G6F53_011181 [Rhizopus delemar]KAG1518410.1 hypothetical protein G6F52_009026 [Rhizopus delemar]